jgi:hypothetical protein
MNETKSPHKPMCKAAKCGTVIKEIEQFRTWGGGVKVGSRRVKFSITICNLVFEVVLVRET